jgi:hypothetical protein
LSKSRPKKGGKGLDFNFCLGAAWAEIRPPAIKIKASKKVAFRATKELKLAI